MAAETVLGVVVETVLSQAFSLASERISRAWGVKDDLERLAGQLEMIQAVLSDAESKSNTSRAVKVWMKKLEDAATDVNYLLDEFAYEVLRKGIEKRNLDKVRNFFSPSNPLVLRYKMASKIRKANLHLDEIFRESDRFGLERQSNEPTSSSIIDIRKDRITDPFVDNLEVVGRNDDVEKIVSVLTSLEDENDLPVIGIVGMAGQGKTTLAKLINKNKEVTKYFEKNIWVCISDDFNVEKILKDILQSLTKNVSNLTMREAMVCELNKELKGKRFLLVLDDVWSEDAELWSCLRRCLQEIGGSRGSKIIVTTRSERVVSTMRAILIHHLGALSEGDSWKLFEKIAFADGEATKTSNMVKIGEKIVERCGGLPLAIKAIGGLLYSRRDATEWSIIAESNLWTSLDTTTKVMDIIKLSYDNLPSRSLKQCFAYCAIFQKDPTINRESLIQQWMAHGLLNPSRESKLEMEDIGNNYFQVLLQRSLFQGAELDMFGNIESCTMHDLVHDFALEISKDRFLTVDSGLKSEGKNVVHLSITTNGSGNGSLDAIAKSPLRLRTLFLFDWSRIFSLDQLTRYKYLSVLVLKLRIRRLPDSVVKLKHLTYLDISRTQISSLPNSITKLYNLQTLRLHELKKLPRGFENLVKLRHFYVFLGGDKLLFPGIGKLTSLCSLPYFLVSQDKRCRIEELGYLQNLGGNLKIYGLENVSSHEEAKKANLSRKGNIVNLELHWGDDFEDAGNYPYEDVLEGL